MERCKRTTKKKTKKKKVKKFTVEVNRSFHNKKSMSKRMSSHRNNVALNKEVLIQRWQHQLINRTHLNFQEFLHLLRQHVWIKFRISFRSLLFRFNIDETWSLVLFDFLFFLSFVLSYCWRHSFAYSIVIQAGSFLNLNGSDLYTKWPSMYIWSVHLFFLNKHLMISTYIYQLTGYPIVRNTFEHSNHSYVLIDVFQMDLIRYH